MHAVRLECIFPYLLVLPAGEYPTPGEGGSVYLGEALSKTIAWLVFHADDGMDRETLTRTRGQQAKVLLRRVNRLLRWYRVATGQATIIELTLAQASPFRFTVEGTTKHYGEVATLEYEAQPLVVPAPGSRADFGSIVQQRLRGKTDPDVATLNLSGR